MSDEIRAPIEHKNQLVGYLEAGEKPREAWRVGTEHEKFGFHLSDLRPISYGGERGVATILEQLAERFGWQRKFEGNNVVALSDPTRGSNISLEPGGQLELSGAPLETVHATCAEVHNHLDQIRDVCAPLGIGFLGAGFLPMWPRSELQRVPKGRYAIMENYMPKVGTHGLDMMFRSCTIQANLDFSSEGDMVQKLRVGLALQPIITAMFANSPFTEGKPNGFLSFRSELWRNLDDSRTGMLPFAFEDGMGYERYVDYALDVPMYFVMRDGRHIDAAGQSFRDFLAGKLPALPGEKPHMGDWADHLSTIFPEVRLKQFLEMRGADGGPWRRLCALPAVWVGLLYSQTAIDAASDLIKDWTDAERQYLRDMVPERALNTPFRETTVRDLARRVLDIAEHGLAERQQKNSFGDDETYFLYALQDIVASGTTSAESLLDRFARNWHGKVTPIYAEEAY